MNDVLLPPFLMAVIVTDRETVAGEILKTLVEKINDHGLENTPE